MVPSKDYLLARERFDNKDYDYTFEPSNEMGTAKRASLLGASQCMDQIELDWILAKARRCDDIVRYCLKK